MMKISLFILSLFFMSGTYVLNNCNHSTDKQKHASQKINVSAQTENFKSFRLPFPEGSDVVIEENTLRFTLPESHYVIGKGADGQYYRSSPGGEGGVRCTCTSGSGCHPSKTGGDYGCVMEGCSSCDKSSSYITGVEAELTDLAIFSSEDVGFIDDFTVASNMFFLHPDFLDTEEIDDLIDEIQEDQIESTSQNTKTILFRAFGYLIPIVVPDDVDDTSLYFKSAGGGDVDTTTCTCHVGENECPLKKRLIVKYCDSDNCTDCEMQGLVVDSDGNEKSLRSEDGRISFQ